MPAVRGPDGKFLKSGQTNPNNQEKSKMADEFEIEFVDELPKISRNVESGVWAKRLAPLEDHVGQWAKVYGPTNNPHAVINNIRSGNAAGVDQERYSFSGRVLGTHTEVDEETGEEVEVKEGYVFARLDTPEQREEREAKQAERKAAREASAAAA
jgi:hypothetical protein